MYPIGAIDFLMGSDRAANERTKNEEAKQSKASRQRCVMSLSRCSVYLGSSSSRFERHREGEEQARRWKKQEERHRNLHKHLHSSLNMTAKATNESATENDRAGNIYAGFAMALGLSFHFFGYECARAASISLLGAKVI